MPETITFNAPLGSKVVTPGMPPSKSRSQGAKQPQAAKRRTQSSAAGSRANTAADQAGAPPGDQLPDSTVFVVHGKDQQLRNELVKFLSAAGLATRTWGEVRATLTLPNPSTIDIVQRGMELATATLVLLTGEEISQLIPALAAEPARRQPRPNVILEMGWALATRPDATVLVRVGDYDLMTDISGLNLAILTNGPDSRRDVLRRLESAGCAINWDSDSWLSSASGGDFDLRFPSIDSTLPEVTDSTLDPDETPEEERLTGQFTPYFIDSALSTELSQENLFEEVRRRVREHQDLELKYHYVGPQLATRWKHVVEEPSYGHDILEKLNSKNMPAIVDAAGLKDTSCALISLGPGDGRIDTAFLKELVKAVSDAQYHLVDISVDLLQLAIQQLHSDHTLRHIPVRAYLADFEKSLGSISLLLREDQRPVLFLLTGFTIGNTREDTIISVIESAMREGDSLLLDARLHKLGSMKGRHATDLERPEIDRLMRAYSSENVKKFIFGPIEVASDFSVDPFDEHREKIVFGTEPKLAVSPVPDAVTVYMTCQGLYNKSYEKFNRKVGMHNMAALKLAREQMRLAQVTFYHHESLREWLRQRFDLKWSISQDDVGMYLVQRSG